MTFEKYVLEYLERQDLGTPIYTRKIACAIAMDYGIDKFKAAAATSVAIKRVMDREKLPDLRCYQKGIYYRTVITPFGEMGICKEKLIADKYLVHDMGYETGLRLLHHMGLTTQMPIEHMIATNVAKRCIQYDKKLGVSICPPKVFVNSSNKRYLQILDSLELLDKAPIDVSNPYTIIADHIQHNNLCYKTLLFYADRYYNRKTIIQIAHTASHKEDKF